MKRFLFLFLFVGLFLQTNAQVSLGGTPKSSNPNLRLSTNVPTFTTPNIDLTAIRAEDAINDQSEGLYRFAIPFQVNYDANEVGTWENLPDGGKLWRINLSAPEAVSMNLIFGRFHLPENSLMYIYNQDKSQILGAFSSHNNKMTGSLATALIDSDFITVEYYEPSTARGKREIVISQIAHGYRGLKQNISERGIDDSGNCQVNVNCSPEGDGIWQDHKKGVARIIINGSGLCSGSLIGNTSNDCKPLFLTADHCIAGTFDAVSAPNANIVFYWNYERVGCANTGTPANQTTSGATVLANDNSGSSSDFALMELSSNPKDFYDVYFNGWDRSGTTGTGGKGIHHPAGDVKMVATHSSNPASVTAGRYWELYWDATTNGYSVTEGGSSGSPLFRTNGRILGQLLGGSSVNCSDPANDRAVYGKISYSWTNGGTASNQRRLSPWLDPTGTGQTTLDGSYDPCAVTNPLVSFTSSSNQSLDEGSSCGTKNILVGVQISQAPNASTTVTISVDGASTSNGDDYTLSTSSVSFGPSDTAEKTITITIDEDAVVEPNETIILNMNVTGSDATESGVQQATITLVNDDFAPAGGTGTTTTNLVNANFETGTDGFATFEETAALGFQIGNNASANTPDFNMVGNNTNYYFINDDAQGTAAINSELYLDAPMNLDLSSCTSASITFDYAYFDGAFQGNQEALEVQVATSTNTTYTTIANGDLAATGTDFANVPWQTITLDLSAYAGDPSVSITWLYSDGGGWNYGAGIDNVSVDCVSGTPTTTVQTATNEGNIGEYAEHNLGPNQTVYFYDQTTGGIMCKIENPTAWDYGCTRVEVDRAGSGVASFVNPDPNTFLHSKTFNVSPANDNPSGNYNITFYYTEAEVAGWESNISGYDRMNAFIHKTKGTRVQDVASGNPGNVDIESIQATVGGSTGVVTYTASFTTGFSGFGVGVSDSPLPVELLSIKGENVNNNTNLLKWITATEINSDFFEIERSKDGESFEVIGKVDAQGQSTEEVEYAFNDKNVKGNSFYYRLRMVDLDGSYEYSSTVFIKLEKSLSLNISPNPGRDIFQITLTENSAENITYQILNLEGKLIQSDNLNVEGGIFDLNLNNLASGVYIIQVSFENGKTLSEKLIKE